MSAAMKGMEGREDESKTRKTREHEKDRKVIEGNHPDVSCFRFFVLS
jgi:hypothetical protein